MILLIISLIIWAMPSERLYEYGSMRYAPSLMDVITAGGNYNYIIILLGFLMVCLMAIDLLTLKKDNVYTEELLKKIETSIQDRNYDKAFKACIKNSSYLSEIFRQSLPMAPAKNEGRNDFIKIATFNAHKTALKLLHKPSKYLLLGTISLLFSVFVTMIAIINSVTYTCKCGPTPSSMAQAIEYSLVIIAVGIISLTAGIIFFFIVKNKANLRVFELKAVYEHLISKFKKE